MSAILRTILLTNARDRMLPGLWALALAVLLVSRALGGAMLVEGRETALAYGSLSLRLVVVGGMVLTVCFQMRRLQETREIEAMLARPISRTGLVLGLAGGYGLLALALALPGVLALGLLLGPDGAGLALWGVSLLLEAWIAAGFALFLACSLGNAASSAMAALALYALARLASSFHDIAQAGIGDWSALAARGPSSGGGDAKAGPVRPVFLADLWARYRLGAGDSVATGRSLPAVAAGGDHL